MDTETLKKNFEEQLATTDKQIAELETNLEKAKEYKLNPPEEETATEEVAE
jgi:hypothetical protein